MGRFAITVLVWGSPLLSFLSGAMTAGHRGRRRWQSLAAVNGPILGMLLLWGEAVGAFFLPVCFLTSWFGVLAGMPLRPKTLVLWGVGGVTGLLLYFPLMDLAERVLAGYEPIGVFLLWAETMLLFVVVTGVLAGRGGGRYLWMTAAVMLPTAFLCIGQYADPEAIPLLLGVGALCYVPAGIAALAVRMGGRPGHRKDEEGQ